MHSFRRRTIEPLRHLALGCMLAAAPVVSRVIVAQDVVVLRGDGAPCPGCALRLSSPVDLKVPDTTDALVSPFAFQQDSRGRFYFNDPFGVLGIRVFDADGHYVRTMGRRGQAPGEFLMLNAIQLDVGDTLHAFGNAHWVFDSAGHHVRTVSTPDLMTVTRVIALQDRSRLFVGSINSSEAYGQPFHIVRRDGTVARSFGLPPRTSAVGVWSSQRIVAATDRDGFVSSRVNTYELEFWSSEGALQRVIRRDASWFPAWTAWDSRSDQRPPPPRLMSIVVDETGLIWTLVTVADANWQRVDATAREGGMPSVGELGRRFDSIIEVIDPALDRIVAWGRFPQMLVALTRPGVAIENVETAEGEVVVRAWKVGRPAR